MFDRNNKKVKTLEVSLGILVGYLLVETVLVLFTDKSWKEAYGNDLIIAAFAGIILSVVLLFLEKRKADKAKAESDGV